METLYRKYPGIMRIMEVLITTAVIGLMLMWGQSQTIGAEVKNMAGTITEMKLDIKELTCDIKTVTRDMNVLSGEVTKVATRVSTREQVIDDIRSNQKRLQKKEWFK